jgi:hypothetical protein
MRVKLIKYFSELHSHVLYAAYTLVSLLATRKNTLKIQIFISVKIKILYAYQMMHTRYHRLRIYQKELYQLYH